MSLKAELSAISLSNSIRRIYLTGFMGAGKSTVGAILAERMKWQFFDTDSVIEKNANASVSKLFSQHGEKHFRQIEADALRELQGEEEAVISLGGGSVETEDVRLLLSQDSLGNLIFLEAPLERLIERCLLQEADGVNRPLLHDGALLQTRYERRLAHYQTAHLTVSTQDMSPEEVAATIMNHLAAFTKWK